VNPAVQWLEVVYDAHQFVPNIASPSRYRRNFFSIKYDHHPLCDCTPLASDDPEVNFPSDFLLDTDPRY
jgi:hypothetical protein